MTFVHANESSQPLEQVPHMRTTLTLDDDLAAELDRTARRLGRSFKDVVNETIRRGLAAAVWVTETKCLGVCPREGCALALSHGGGVFEGVSPADVRGLLDRIEGKSPR